MATTYHRAQSNNGYLRLCSHSHATLVSAVACISSAGEFIVARKTVLFRALTNAEQMEYKNAVYGGAIDHSIATVEGCCKKQFT